MSLALLSVSDKTGIVEFGQGLSQLGYTLLSTGGTARVLRQAGLDVVDVSDFTKHPEMMQGRVKTLHPKVHGGILGLREKHAQEASRHGVEWIDVVAVNLYPFAQTVKKPGVTVEDAIENIDIGGPSMLRSAAKNHSYVHVVCDPTDYENVLDKLRDNSPSFRKKLAVKAFQHTAYYDGMIAQWMQERFADELPEFPNETAIPVKLSQVLRYGENPQQQAAFYIDPSSKGRTLQRMNVHQGKALSFNNIADVDAALRMVYAFDRTACVIVKHMNPCGAAVHDESPGKAFQLALSADPISAFGGILAFNRKLEADDVRTIRKARTFFEVVVAPGFTNEALELFSVRERLRVISIPQDWDKSSFVGMDARRVAGGWLRQHWDKGDMTSWDCGSKRNANKEDLETLDFAWRICQGIKSNAIVLAKAIDGGFVINGVGAGQMSRVDSVRLAIQKATKEVTGSVLASDAFFPKPDGVEEAINVGIKYFVQPGGSIKDSEVISTIDNSEAVMYITQQRHFRH
jgi:phosphoribosylaminoimidazolecarboxamide formyltransferase / IMP cyclohydrolase